MRWCRRSVIIIMILIIGRHRLRVVRPQCVNVSSIGRFLEPPFRSQEPFPLPPAILDDVTSVSGSGNGSWLLNGGSKNLPVFRLSAHMYIGMSPLAQVDQIPWPGDRQTVECGQHLGTWWRVCHFFFFFFFFFNCTMQQPRIVAQYSVIVGRNLMSFHQPRPHYDHFVFSSILSTK